MTYSFASSHRIQDGKPEVLRPWNLARSLNPAGGVISTAGDQMRYARFHLGGGTAQDGTRLLKRETLEAMQSEQAPAASFAQKMGIGWRLLWADGVKIVAHGDGTLGQASSFDLVPERQFAITALSNVRDRLFIDEIVTWAFEHFAGIAPPDRVPLDLPADQLEAYTGIYSAHGGHAEIYVKDGELWLQTRPTRGFPTPDVPPPPTPPPARLAFFKEDFVFLPDSPKTRFWSEFIRNDDGSILGFHSGARLMVREKTL
jgi:CubicO group peptidase (beta-lactamase class C family)